MDIMLDIESFSLAPNAMVLSIGAVAFNIATGEVRRELYVKLNCHAQIRCKRDMSVDTVRWWIRQAQENPGAATEILSDDGAVGCAHALHLLDKLFADTAADDGGLDNVWANGPQFDIVALSTLYDDLGLIAPWKYNQVRDFRTVRWLIKHLGLEWVEPPAQHTAHHALHDAQWQATALANMLHAIREGGAG